MKRAARSAETVVAFLRRSLLLCADTLAAAVPRVMDDKDPQAVHDVRVAVRRLRVLLRLAREVFGRAQVKALRAACASLQQATSSLRDLEVLSETIHGLKSKEVAFKSVRAREVKVALRLQLIELCRSGAVERIQAMLAALLTSPAKAASQRRLRPWARASVEAAERQVTRQLKRGRGPTRLHRLRLTFKRLRYTVELLTELLPPAMKALAPLAARAQRALGEIHDLDVAIDQLKRSDLFAHAGRARGRVELQQQRKQKAHQLKAGALHAFA